MTEALQSSIPNPIEDTPILTPIEVILQELLSPFHITVSSISDLKYAQIDREDLLAPAIKTLFLSKVPMLKLHYNSSKLSCLHKNAIEKQKYPQINLLRQILKCNQFSLTPKVVSMGYDPTTGKKLVKRSYVLCPIESEIEEEEEDADESV